jgi:hypothetical protein
LLTRRRGKKGKTMYEKDKDFILDEIMGALGLSSDEGDDYNGILPKFREIEKLWKRQAEHMRRVARESGKLRAALDIIAHAATDQEARDIARDALK